MTTAPSFVAERALPYPLPHRTLPIYTRQCRSVQPSVYILARVADLFLHNMFALSSHARNFCSLFARVAMCTQHCVAARGPKAERERVQGIGSREQGAGYREQGIGKENGNGNGIGIHCYNNHQKTKTGKGSCVRAGSYDASNFGLGMR